jgi:IS5 family transposase
MMEADFARMQVSLHGYDRIAYKILLHLGLRLHFLAQALGLALV